MKVLVLGAGVVGVTTAYYLAKQDHDVVVIDLADEPGAGASHANGGQLSYSYTDAFARPEILSKLPGLLLGRDPSVQMTMSLDLIRWGLSFVGQCTRGRAGKNSSALLKMALRSADLIDEINRELGLEFAFRKAGKLVLLPESTDLQAARLAAESKRLANCDVSVISREQAADLEPALINMPSNYAGAIYGPDDEVADARRFAGGLASWLEKKAGVTFSFGTRAEAIRREGEKVVGIRSSAGDIDGDAVVVCLGAASGELLGPVGLAPPIIPVRGYSVTLPPGPDAPLVSLTDLQHKVVFSNLDRQIRIAGFTDFHGYNGIGPEARIGQMVDVARRIAPGAADYQAPDQKPWSGLRPMTPDSLPRVGATPLDGLFLNTGHGALGWTLACATAESAARIITGQSS